MVGRPVLRTVRRRTLPTTILSQKKEIRDSNRHPRRRIPWSTRIQRKLLGQVKPLSDRRMRVVSVKATERASSAAAVRPPFRVTLRGADLEKALDNLPIRPGLFHPIPHSLPRQLLSTNSANIALWTHKGVKFSGYIEQSRQSYRYLLWRRQRSCPFADLALRYDKFVRRGGKQSMRIQKNLVAFSHDPNVDLVVEEIQGGTGPNTLSAGCCCCTLCCSTSRDNNAGTK